MKILNIRGECASRSLKAARVIAKHWEENGFSVKVIPQAHFQLFREITGLEAKKIDKFLDLFQEDYLILEGDFPVNAPNLVVSLFEEDFENELTIGKVSDTSQVDENLIRMVDELTICRMPNFNADCCTACGSDCKGMTRRVLFEGEDPGKCVMKKGDVEVLIDGKSIPMVPFVKRLVRNVSTSVVKELDGYSENSEIEIRLR